MIITVFPDVKTGQAMKIHTINTGVSAKLENGSKRVRSCAE